MKAFEFNDDIFDFWDDLEKILEHLNNKGKLNITPKRVEELYYAYSDEVWCAQWMSINDEILQKIELSCNLIDFLKTNYPKRLEERYQVEEECSPSEILEAIARNRGCLLKGNELNYEKAAGILLEEFRNGKLGRVSVEQPE